jgi:hypothetical protein
MKNKFWLLIYMIQTLSVSSDSSRSSNTLLERYMAQGSGAVSKEFPFWPIQGTYYSPPNILQCIFPFILHVNTAEFNMVQVTIGSEDLKANHAIVQHVEILSESQKYNK